MSSHLVQSYLFFNGRCEEALAFYEKAIGAQVQMKMRFSENPDPPEPGTIPPDHEDKIMHASFQVGDTVLMASDGCGNEQGFGGFCLSLTVPNEEQAAQCFAALADGGSVTMPLGKTFWSPCFGIVQDRFGIGWMVTTPES
jgi:PhnB protein